MELKKIIELIKLAIMVLTTFSSLFQKIGLPAQLQLHPTLYETGKWCALVGIIIGFIVALKLGKIYSNISVVLGIIFLILGAISIISYWSYARGNPSPDDPYSDIILITLWSSMFIFLVVGLTFTLAKKKKK